MNIVLTWPMYLRNELGVDGFAIPLSGNQMKLVSVLVMRRGHIIPRPELIELMWPDPDDEPDYPSNMIDHIIKKVNGKVPGLIQHIKQRGTAIWR